jgi:hypothetical protein
MLMGIGRGTRINWWLLKPVVLLNVCQNFGLLMMRQLTTDRRHGMAMVWERVLQDRNRKFDIVWLFKNLLNSFDFY